MWASCELPFSLPWSPLALRSTAHVLSRIATSHLRPVPFNKGTLLDLWSENSASPMTFGGLLLQVPLRSQVLLPGWEDERNC